MFVPTFRRLQVFVAVAETGSFAAAARRLGIAQPSVSAHIQSLEKDCAGPLFERRMGKEPILTEIGRTFLLHARGLLANASKLQADVAPRVGGDQQLNIACQRSLATAVLRASLVDFAQSNRDIRTSVRVAFQEEVVASIRKGEVDIGLLLGNEPVEGLATKLIGRQKFIIYGAPGHPLAGRSRIPPAELSGVDFVSPPERTVFGRTIMRLLASIGIAPIRITAETTEFSMSREFTVAGLGLCCSLEASVQADLDSGRLVRIDLDAPPLFVDILQLANPKRIDAEAVKRFSDFMGRAGSGWG